MRQFLVGLSPDARMYAGEKLNRTLADTQIYCALYKKSHWNVRGPTFYQLHLLLDEHAEEQLALIDAIVAVGDPRHAAELSGIPRPPDGVERVPTMGE